MLSCKEILNLKEDKFFSYFEGTPINEFLEPILIKYPDYYNLRGKYFGEISENERNLAVKLLKAELKI